MGSPDIDKSEETNRHIDSNTTKCNSKQQTVEKANERPEWLPDGWNVEFRTRKSGALMGSGYKCYIDPLNGYKFYSKPEVLRYLETIKDKDNSCTLKKEKKRTNMHSPTDAVVEKSTLEDLPPGWVKEVKIRKNSNGIRKDPFYKDPVNGYVFRSKKDVLRYLESGDIRSCAFRPSRRQIQDEDNLTPSPAAKGQKWKRSAAKQLSVGVSSSGKGQDGNVRSGVMVASVLTCESAVKMHDGAANSSEMKKASDPASSELPKNEYLKESEKVPAAGGVEEKEHVNMTENANEKNYSNHSISKNKEFNVRHRFSPRLAGIKPVQSVNNVIDEQTLQVPKRNSRKSRDTLDVDMENKLSQHFNGVPEIEHMHEMQQEVKNISNNISEDQAVSKEQPCQHETDKIEDNEPEIQTNSNKSSNKKGNHIPRRASKRLARIEHESTNSISCVEATKYESKSSEDEVNVELQQSEGGSVAVLSDHAPMNGESANKRKKSPKISSTAEKQLKKLEDEEMYDEKSEHQLSFAFHYSWSDPSLEFAINTLTGVLPPVENSVDNRPTSVPETEIQKPLIDNVTGQSGNSQNNLLDTDIGSRDRNSQVRSNKPKRKKEHKVPMRLSKRLAGLEPEIIPSERALEYSTRKSCKEEPTATAILTNRVSDHLYDEEETKLTLQASDSLKTEVLGESSNKGEKSCDTQTVLKEQLQKVEAENIDDEISEPQFPLPFGDSWSDPCLEFAIKTLTGALPVDAGADVLPVMTPDIYDPPYEELHGSVVTSINEVAHDNSNQSQNKRELNMTSQPELRTSSTSCENAPKFTTRVSYDQGNTIGYLDGKPQYFNAGNIPQPVHHSTNINTLTCEEPLKENGQVFKGESVTAGQQLIETETINNDNSELQFCASFMNSWSDPCLEFAFKTLTGVIPVEENLPMQGCFQEPANYHERKHGGSTLPDFGSSSFSQNDISFHYDTGVKSMQGQQSSTSSSFLPLEKASLQGFPEVDPKKHYPQCNNTFQKKCFALLRRYR
ncbi:methyl-CpG-binding domain-containing protein 13-like isoform X3 [Abrus precatorius]|uniref:Methyl-CpG-binding domain-containing protein 13-like isoform X3 n=1 Tax=Abrus precatorius TaxID=3816 RepID=A0A8B8KBT1_ABRPR|nr:methyl-CpG-binding domain-containing protein 13-like isoform X3 [Abrus precatorius]